MSSDAPEVPTPTTVANRRVVLVRRAEFGLIAAGGVFIILGWGIGHQEWARALGWLLTGFGFAIEMVYGRLLKPAQAKESGEQPTGEQETEQHVTDESTR